METMNRKNEGLSEEEKAEQLKEQLKRLTEREAEGEQVLLSDVVGGMRQEENGRHHRGRRHSSRNGRHHHYKSRRKRKILIGLLCGVFGVCTISAVSVFAFWSSAGRLKQGMFGESFVSDVDTMEETKKQIDDASAETAELPDAYAISYRGSKYVYNENMVNILFMGIDATNENQFAHVGVNSHQADTLILAAIDSEKQDVTLIHIPRDSVTEIKVLDANMNYARSIMGPITIQHSFGDGKTISNELTEDAVSNLLYAVPIYRYVSMNMDAIPVINDAVGGVTLELLEDMTAYNKNMKQGVTYELMGKDAWIYTTRRDVKIDDSAIGRMKRQMQYMKALFEATKAKTKENITFPVTMFLEVKESIQTNLSISEITYLAKQMLNIELTDEKVETVPGQLREIEEGEFEEYQFPLGYVVDEEALKDLIIRVFYTEVQ